MVRKLAKIDGPDARSTADVKDARQGLVPAGRAREQPVIHHEQGQVVLQVWVRTGCQQVERFATRLRALNTEILPRRAFSVCLEAREERDRTSVSASCSETGEPE